MAKKERKDQIHLDNREFEGAQPTKDVQLDSREWKGAKPEKPPKSPKKKP